MATTLVAFLAVRITVTYWVRPHFAGPIKLTQSLAAQSWKLMVPSVDS